MMSITNVRRASQALAGAAILAAALTTAAAAAPAGGLPLPFGAETVAQRQGTTLPIADISVLALSETGSLHHQKIVKFKVTNSGPQAASASLERFAYLIDSNGDGSPATSTFNSGMLAPGESKEYMAVFTAPSGGKIYGVSLTAKTTGVDPDTTNNSAGYDFHDDPGY